MQSRLTLHFQALPGWTLDWVRHVLRNGGELYVKWINPDEHNPFEGLPVRVIGRVHPDDDDETKRWLRDGEPSADKFFHRWYKFYKARRWVWAWETPNEPGMMSLEEVHALVAFVVRFCHLMHREGWRVAGLNTSVGWPALGYDKEPDDRHGASDIPILAPAYDACDIWTFHEYGWPQMWTGEGFYCLRYRESKRQLLAEGVKEKPIGITECGLDGILVGPTPRGWREQDPPLSFESYLGQLAWYDQHLEADNVRFAAIFNAPGERTWGTYELRQEEAWRLADYIGLYPPRWEPESVTSHIADMPPEESSTIQDITPAVINMIGKLPTYAKVQPGKELAPFRHREMDDIKRVVVHHSTGAQRPPGDIRRWIRRVARWQIRKYGWQGFAYHAVVDAGGMLYLTNDVKTVTHHSGNWDVNDDSLALLLIGDFRYGHDVPTDAQLATARWYVQKTGKPVLAHKRVPHPKAERKWIATACPGDLRQGWWRELRRASQ